MIVYYICKSHYISLASGHSANQWAIVDSVSCKFASASVLCYSAYFRFAMMCVTFARLNTRGWQVDIAQCNALQCIVGLQ